MDERMMAPSADVAWPLSCKLCRGNEEASRMTESRGREPPRRELWDSAFSRDNWYKHEEGAAHRAFLNPHVGPSAAVHPGQVRSPYFTDVWPHSTKEQQQLLNRRELLSDPRRGPGNSSNWALGHSMEEAESLEPPLPLVSNINCERYAAPHMPGECSSWMFPIMRSEVIQ